MKIKNISQTVQVTANSLINPVQYGKDALAKFKEASEASDAEEQKKLEDEGHKLLPLEVQATLKAWGVEKLNEPIALKLTVGGFFYEMILSVWEKDKPQAPLKLAIYQKKLQDCAERMTADELEVDSEDLKIIRGVLDDDAKWAQVKISAESEKTGETIGLTSQGVVLFQDILTAAVDIFEAEKEEFESKKKTKKASKKKTSKKTSAKKSKKK